MRQRPVVPSPISPDFAARQEASPDAAEIRGREAFLAGVSRGACPFALESVQRVRWVEGWDAAQALRQALDVRWGREA